MKIWGITQTVGLTQSGDSSYLYMESIVSLWTFSFFYLKLSHHHHLHLQNPYLLICVFTVVWYYTSKIHISSLFKLIYIINIGIELHIIRCTNTTIIFRIYLKIKVNKFIINNLFLIWFTYILIIIIINVTWFTIPIFN